MYFFYLIEQHSKFLLPTLQVLYMCTLFDSTVAYDKLLKPRQSFLLKMIVVVLTSC